MPLEGAGTNRIVLIGILSKKGTALIGIFPKLSIVLIAIF